MDTISTARSFAYTLFLFTKTDFKRVYFQMLVFASVTGPLQSAGHLALTAFWAWSHLLEVCISNQCARPEEDRLNKPFRPIPAGGMSLEFARKFRWMVLTFNFALSSFLDSKTLLPISVVFTLYNVLYNDCGLDVHWLWRNVLNAVGVTAWFAGAVQVAGGLQQLDAAAHWALCVSFGITLTTYFVTDFDDLEGDKAVGRRTIPIMAPKFSRWIALGLLVGWSVFLSRMWDLPLAVALSVLALALTIGGRLVARADESSDHKACVYYVLWFALVHLLPGVWRIRHSGERLTFSPPANYTIIVGGVLTDLTKRIAAEL